LKSDYGNSIKTFMGLQNARKSRSRLKWDGNRVSWRRARLVRSTAAAAVKTEAEMWRK